VINVRHLFLIGVIALGLAVPAADAQTAPKKRSPKIDKALSEAMSAGGATQRVIITLPGHRAEMRSDVTNTWFSQIVHRPR
jgi:hypothetical protein